MSFTRPQLIAMSEFEGADIWGQDGDEEFSDQTGVECALRVLEQETFVPQTGAVAEWLKGNPTFITVKAHRRDQISPSQTERWAEWITEGLREHFSEEHGNPNDGDDGLSDDEIKELGARSLELATWYVSKATVFTCETLRSFTLDSEDILELVQECRPHWLLSPS